MIAAEIALAVLWLLTGGDTDCAQLLTALAARLQVLQSALPVEVQSAPANGGDIIIGLKSAGITGSMPVQSR